MKSAEHFNLWAVKMKLFSDHFLEAEYFFSKKIRQMKASQNNKYDITKTSGLVQFWPCPFTTQLFLGRA